MRRPRSASSGSQRVALYRIPSSMMSIFSKLLFARVLNKAVRRNLKRFPKDFIFKLTQPEKNQVITLCDHLKNLKYAKALPNAS
jgi:hypothetical protein